MTELTTAKKMANEKYINSWKRGLNRYSILDNPYSKNAPLHVVWHNEFYNECKKINRRTR